MVKKLVIIALFIFLIPVIVFAAGGSTNNQKQDNAGGSSDKTVTLTDPLGVGNSDKGPQQLIGRIIKGVLGLVGSLALAMFIYGGFTWMLAAGNPSSVEKGKQILIWATIGLIVIFSSYALVQFVFVDVLGV